MNTIKIGSVDYAVVMDDGLKREGLIGQCDYNAQEVRLCPTILDDRRETVFWHEILHAIFEQIGEEQNEALIDRLSYAIHGVLKANASFSLFQKINNGENK